MKTMRTTNAERLYSNIPRGKAWTAMISKFQIEDRAIRAAHRGHNDFVSSCVYCKVDRNERRAKAGK